MRRISRLFAVVSLFSLVALLPVAAQASNSLTEYVVGTEYAVGSCPGGDSGSFAGYGSATLSGQANAIFNTTICHTPLGDTNGATATILPGGSFTLATSSVALAGQYNNGAVGRGTISPLFAGFCKEVFPVTADLVAATSVPPGVTNITGGSATGTLTHIGFYVGTACQPFAATIAGKAILTY